MKTKCPHCSQKYELDDEFSEKAVVCDMCGKDFVVKPLGPTSKPLPPPVQSVASPSVRHHPYAMWAIAGLVVIVAGVFGGLWLYDSYKGSLRDDVQDKESILECMQLMKEKIEELGRTCDISDAPGEMLFGPTALTQIRAEYHGCPAGSWTTFTPSDWSAAGKLSAEVVSRIPLFFCHEHTVIGFLDGDVGGYSKADFAAGKKKVIELAPPEVQAIFMTKEHAVPSLSQKEFSPDQEDVFFSVRLGSLGTSPAAELEFTPRNNSRFPTIGKSQWKYHAKTLKDRRIFSVSAHLSKLTREDFRKIKAIAEAVEEKYNRKFSLTYLTEADFVRDRQARGIDDIEIVWGDYRYSNSEVYMASELKTPSSIIRFWWMTNSKYDKYSYESYCGFEFSSIAGDRLAKAEKESADTAEGKAIKSTLRGI